MGKRKLSDCDEPIDAEHVPSNPNLHKHRRQASRLQETLDGSTRALSGSLRIGRGFERQKLGRRQKTARQSGDNGQLKRLEEEVTVLKNLDLSLMAQRHLYKQMIKTKRIAESPGFQQLQASEALRAGPSSPAEANVTARLFSSNPVKQVMPGIMSDIRGVLGIDEKDKRKDKEQSGQESRDTQSKNGGVDGRRQKVSNGLHLGESADGLATDSDISTSSSDGENVKANPGAAKTPSASSAPKHKSDTESESDSDSASSAGHISQKSKAKVKAKSAPIENPTTTFLPTLMGGYWSGSESDASDNDDEAARIQPPRKNRPGQQARRALWEKKYGSGANHVKKEQQKTEQEKQGRDSGWDVKRGATGEGDRKSTKRDSKHKTAPNDRGSKGQGRGRTFGDGERDKRRPQPQKPQDNKPLHPSWEAAKKAKEQRHANFQGKKITFD